MRYWRWIWYMWTSPNTALGLALGLLGLVTGGKFRRMGPCLEFSGGVLRYLLACMPTGSGAVAMTLGHVILGVNEQKLELVRRHEWVHVRQYELWGVFFIPAYLLASGWQILRGRDAYQDNPFEREAFRLENFGE